MSECLSTEAGYMEYQPTRLERFWIALGFGCRVPEATEAMEKLPGWMISNIVLRPSFGDRLRFLFCGSALVRVLTHTEHTPGHALSASSFELKPPFFGEPGHE